MPSCKPHLLSYSNGCTRSDCPHFSGFTALHTTRSIVVLYHHVITCKSAYLFRYRSCASLAWNEAVKSQTLCLTNPDQLNTVAQIMLLRCAQIIHILNQELERSHKKNGKTSLSDTRDMHSFVQYFCRCSPSGMLQSRLYNHRPSAYKISTSTQWDSTCIQLEQTPTLSAIYHLSNPF